MARNAPDRASLVRVMKNARAVKNVEKPDRLRAGRATRNAVARDHEMKVRAVPVRAMVTVMKPDRLPVARAMASGAISVRRRMVRVMVNDGSSATRIVDLARPVRRMARGIMVPGTEIVATLARRRVARVTSARLAMGNAVMPVRLPVVRAMANDGSSVPRIVVQEAMNATASARAMVVRIEVARGKTA